MPLETCPWDPEADDPYTGLLSWMRRNVERNADNCIIVDGYEGVGKSTFAMRLVHDLYAMRNDGTTWDPSWGLILNHRDWASQWATRVEDQAYIIDEGGNLLFSRDTQRTENKIIVKVLQQARVLRSTTIICCPNKWWLDPYVRQHRARAWVHVGEQGERRGYAWVMWREYNWRKNEVDWYDAGEIRFPDLPKDFPWLAGYKARKIDALSMTSQGDDRPERVRRRRRSARVEEPSIPTMNGH